MNRYLLRWSNRILLAIVVLAFLGLRFSGLVARLFFSLGSVELAHVAGADALCQIASATSRLDRSEDWFQMAAVWQPGWARSYARLGTMSHLAGNDERARDYLRLAAQLEPDNTIVHFDLGNLLEAAGQREEALVEWRKAAAYLVVGDLLLSERKFAEARRWYQLAEDTGTAPRGVVELRILQSYGTEGQYAREAGDGLQSGQACQELIWLAPHQPSGYYCLALTEAWCNKDYEQGIELMRQAIEVAPNEPLFYAYLGRLWREKGDLDRAEVYARMSLERGPNDAVAHAEMGQLWMARNRPREAVTEFLQAIAIRPEAWYYLRLGDAYLQIEDRAAAERAYAQALQIAPNWQDVVERLRSLEEGE